MARLAPLALEKLTARGLVVSEPFVAGHVAYPDGVIVGKPEAVGGHSVPNHRVGWGASGLLLDAPTVVLHGDGERWFVTLAEWAPGPGPSDFVREFSTLDGAIADVLDFFFGDVARMQKVRDSR